MYENLSTRLVKIFGPERNEILLIDFLESIILMKIKKAKIVPKEEIKKNLEDKKYVVIYVDEEIVLTAQIELREDMPQDDNNPIVIKLLNHNLENEEDYYNESKKVLKDLNGINEEDIQDFKIQKHSNEVKGKIECEIKIKKESDK